MARKTIAIVLVISVLFTGCRKEGEKPETFSCETLVDGLLLGNNQKVETQINIICSQLVPTPDVLDTAGLRKQIDKMVSILIKNCNVEANVLCYGCIKTLPPQSEVRLSFTHNGGLYHKIIDISSPENHVLRFAGMHD